MKEVLGVGHDCYVPSGRSCSVLYPSQCHVSAELVPDVNTVANRTDSVLTELRRVTIRSRVPMGHSEYPVQLLRDYADDCPHKRCMHEKDDY